MPDEPKDTPIKDKEEPKEEGYVYARDHNKSPRVIAREEAAKARKARDEQEETKPATPETAPSDTKETPKAETPDEKRSEEVPGKPAVDDKAIHNQRLVEEAAEKAAAKATESLKAELAKVEQSKNLTKEEKIEKKEELKSKWSQEGRTPKDYDEIYEEAKNAAKREVLEEIDRREAERAKATQERTAAEQAAKEAREKQEADYRSSVERMTMDELSEMEREGIKLSEAEQKALFQKGLEINTQRMATINPDTGRPYPPIISISRIYHNYYKQSKPAQPAGADAPVAGAANTPAQTPAQDKYVYSRDHNKTIRQLMAETFKK